MWDIIQMVKWNLAELIVQINALPSLWAFPLEEEEWEQRLMWHRHQPAAWTARHLFCFNGGHFPFMERESLQTLWSIQASHPPGLPRNASRDQILQNQDSWISHKSLWIRINSTFSSSLSQIFFFLASKTSRLGCAVSRFRVTFMFCIIFCGAKCCRGRPHPSFHDWNEQRSGGLRHSYLSLLVLTSTSSFISDLTLFSANFFSRPLSVET